MHQKEKILSWVQLYHSNKEYYQYIFSEKPQFFGVFLFLGVDICYENRYINSIERKVIRYENYNKDNR